MILRMPIVKGYNLWTVSADEARRKVAVEYIVKGLESGALLSLSSTGRSSSTTWWRLTAIWRATAILGKIVVTV